MQRRTYNQIKTKMADRRALLRCAKNFNIAGDLTRLKICFLLCHAKGLSVGEIAEAVGVSISAVSHTMKKLQKADIVESKRRHRHVYYRLTKSPFTNVIKKQIA